MCFFRFCFFLLKTSLDWILREVRITDDALSHFRARRRRLCISSNSSDRLDDEHFAVPEDWIRQNEQFIQ
jgi:hypothetical protein